MKHNQYYIITPAILLLMICVAINAGALPVDAPGDRSLFSKGATIAVLYPDAPYTKAKKDSFPFPVLTKATLLSSEESEEDKDSNPKFNYFGQSLCIFFPLIGERVKDNSEIERNIYPLGIGGGLEYRTNILNRLFSSPIPQSGMILGITFTFYMMEPQKKYQDFFGELTILTAGLYTGYQFIFPVSQTVNFSPLIYAGGRYYVSFHFFEEEISMMYNPIIISGIDFGIIFNNTFSLSIRGEYQIYIAAQTNQIINVFLGSGIYY